MAVAASLAATALARPADAAPSARLLYARGPGAETCPDEQGLRHAVAARIGYDPFFPWAALTVSVEITSDAGKLHGRILLETGGIEKGAQTIHEVRRDVAGPAGCEELIASIALAVSVALDAEREATAGAPDVAPAPPPEPPPALPLPPPSPRRLVATKPTPAVSPAPVSPRKKLSLWVSAGVRGSFGEWQSVAIAPDLLVEARLGRWSLAVEGRYDVPVTTFTIVSGETASVARWTGSLLPCAHFGWFVPCAVATFGESVATAGGGLANPTSGTGTYLALGARAGLDVPLTARLHLLGTADLVGIVTPANVTDGTATTTGTVGSNSVEASLGIALFVPIL